MRKILSPIFIAAALAFTSCADYLDINTDPNSPSVENMNADIVFPAAEMNLATSYGDFLRIVGGYYSQHYSQLTGTSNYVDYSQFIMSATRSSGTYTQLYTRVLGNLEFVRKDAVSKEDWGSYLAATVLKGFTMQVLVDCYGETPYSEAFDTSIPSPKYDEGEDVYKGVIAELDEALSKVAGPENVCTNFLFPSAKASEWVKFANALKLKMYMRMGSSSAELDALVAEGNFPAGDVAWADCWSDEAAKSNPYYAEEFGSYFAPQKNVCLNLTLQATMADYGDNRLQAFFDPNESGVYTGAISGTNFSASASTHKVTYWCRPSVKYNSPVYLLTVAEVDFFLAEYYAKKSSMALAKSWYEAAVDASFASAGVSGSEDVYAATSPYCWSDSQWKKVVGIQKWIALSGVNNFEAWCELRRLGYPEYGTQKGETFYNIQSGSYDVSGYVPGYIYEPITVNDKLNARQVLQRFPYANSSTSRNNNAPATKAESVPVFWAK
ncbi:MAG: SusD/RagB family nutrient-binding outer membrane lipoprotein [Candidatus Cryptobacteroides sp.]